jgi:hypothetical protein
MLKSSTTGASAMATVNFSVPDEVKEAFNAAFKGRNKSAVIAELMREAVEREHRNNLRHDAVRRILDRRERAPRVTDDELSTDRRSGRP